jgi:hypothetical protein
VATAAPVDALHSFLAGRQGQVPLVKWPIPSPAVCMVGVAQLVERRVVVADVAGSSPVTHPTQTRRARAHGGPASTCFPVQATPVRQHRHWIGRGRGPRGRDTGPSIDDNPRRAACGSAVWELPPHCGRGRVRPHARPARQFCRGESGSVGAPWRAGTAPKPPDWKSANAFWTSSRVFITNGPAHATGSLIGRPPSTISSRLG